MKLIIVLLHLLSLSAFSAPKKSFEHVKRQKLLSMISKEIKSIKKVKRRGPNLEYRLLELYSENLKIIKEVENNNFLKNKNLKYKKSHFFKKSIKLNKLVEKLGLYITKKWKNYRSNAAIYYTLALNERDFNNSKRTEYYLKKSLRVAPNNSPIVHNIKTSLAEMYYNDKLYKKAVKYYLDVIKNNGDEWYAKHHYNLGWCLLKTRRKKSALSHVLKAYQVSKNPRYVSVESQVLDAISIFYIQNDLISQGTKFYIDNVKEPAEYLTKFATRAQSTKKFSQINPILLSGINSAKKSKQFQELVIYYNYQLEFYRTFKQENMHIETAKKLTTLDKKNKLLKEDKEISTARIKSFVGYLQIRISKKQMSLGSNIQKNKLKNILTYFELLKLLDKESKNSYTFYQGETLYSVSEFTRAYKRYALVLEQIKKNKKIEESNKKLNKAIATPLKWDEKFSKKVINSLLATLTKLEEQGLKNPKHKTYVYSNHINLWPRDSKSRIIYPKLFSIYFKSKNIKKSVEVINSYNQNFKIDLKSQKGMFAKVFDHFVTTKNIVKISYWINKFNNGYLSYEAQYIKKATILLANLLFVQIDKKIANKNYDGAKEDYLKILENKTYPQKIKTQSTYRMAILELKKLNIKSSWKWMKSTFKMDKNQELFKEVTNIKNMVSEYTQAQDFKRALSLSYITLKSYCNRSYKEKKSLFINAMTYSIIENNKSAIAKLKRVASKCQINQNIVKSEITNFSYQMSLKGDLKGLLWFDKTFPSFISKTLISKTAERKYWRARSQGQLTTKLRMFKIMNKYGSKSVGAIQEYDSFLKLYEKSNYNFTTSKFDGQLFNKEIETNISHLKAIQTSGNQIQKNKHPMITPNISLFLAKQYTLFLSQINSFIPFGFNKKEVLVFKKQLIPLIKNIEKEKKNYNLQAKNTIESNTILSFENHSLKESNSTKANVLMRYPASLLSLSLDIQGVE